MPDFNHTEEELQLFTHEELVEIILFNQMIRLRRRRNEEDLHTRIRDLTNLLLAD
tara:strand:- start:1234 stop:1398 length:165 start_codon:yes stop_codon:yes gene_type:complete